MEDSSSVLHSQLLKENQLLIEKLTRSQQNFEKKIDKTIKNLLEIEIPRIKTNYNQEIGQILKDHEKSLNLLISKTNTKYDTNPIKNDYLSKVQDQRYIKNSIFEKKHDENNFFMDKPRKIHDSFKESFTISQKPSYNYDDNSKIRLENIYKPSLHEFRSTKNITKSIMLQNNKENELKKRFEKFQVTISSSSSSLSSDSTKSKEKTKNLKGKKAENKKKEKNSSSEIFSD